MRITLLLMERTLVLIKPLGLQNALLQVLGALKSVGTIVRRQLVSVTEEQIRTHYAEHASKPWFPRIVEYYQGQTVMALILEGPDVIARLRAVVGPSDPRKAAPDQIRSLVLAYFQDGKKGWSKLELVTSGVDNFIHASDSEEASVREIALWFPKE